MRVTHRMLTQSVSRNIQRNLRMLEKRSNQLSMGRLFDRPSQDPVGTYKVMKITGTGLKRIEQYRRNIGEGISWLTITEGALAEAIDVLQRLRELAVYTANEIFAPTDRRMVAPEVEQLLHHLIGLGNTELTGLYIFGGYQTQSPPYKVAGVAGHLLESWINEESGIVQGGIEVENFATGTYAISTEAGISGPKEAQVTIISQYVQGARENFFGTAEIKVSIISENQEKDLDKSGSVALEIVEKARFSELSLEGEEYKGWEENDLIVRLSVRYYLYSLEGEDNYLEGHYGLRKGEEIYLNLNRLLEEDQQFSFKINSEEKINLTVGKSEGLTFEGDVPLVGDKVILKLKAALPDNGTYDRFSLHKVYGKPGEEGYPLAGETMDWFFTNGFLNEKIPVFKFFDLDKRTGELFTSSIAVKFDQLSTATLEDLPAAIFSFVAPGDPYYVGDSGRRLVEITPGNTLAINVTGEEAFDGVGLFQLVRSMHTALIQNDQHALQKEIIEGLDYHLEKLLKYRSEVGARMERLNVTDERLHVEHIYLRELRSKVEDLDLAEAITEFMMQENAYHAALATGARMIYPSLIDFLR